MQDRAEQKALKASTSQTITGQDSIGLQNIADSNIQIIVNRLGEPELLRLAGLIAEKRPDLLNSDDREKLILLRTALGLTEGAIEAFFRILSQEQVPPERLAAKLVEIATQFKSLLEQARLLSSDDSEVNSLSDKAIAAIEAGRFEVADDYLAKAEEHHLAAVRQLEEVSGERRVSAAAIRAERGQTSLLRLRYLEAAAHFQAASQLLPGIEMEKRRSYREAQANALDRQGREKGDNSALAQAIALYRELLAEIDRKRVPLDWATTQNNLGNALWALGQRESGAARLEEAAEAYRAALEERTRERVPLDWAATQTNLGNALSVLGQRESGTARLEEAVDAFRAALKERTRERVPLQWAATQTNLGTALWALGERESSTAWLEEAVDAFRAALEERTRERVPLEWALTQTNLGTALWALGERESSMARLEEAVDAFRAALEERTRERVPLDWAMTQNNLGNALRALGEHESGMARLEEGVGAYRGALEIFEAAGADHYVMLTRQNLVAMEHLMARGTSTA